MRLEDLKEAINGDTRPPRKAPKYLIYMPPSGAPVECPAGFDIAQAGAAASRIASRHPGSAVAVYALVGTAIAPIAEPDFIPTSNERFLLDASTGDPSAA
jgi:hypothetical protein